MSALEDRLRRFAYEWNEAMNRPYTVNMMTMLRKAASDVRSLVAPSSEAENAKLMEMVSALSQCLNWESCKGCPMQDKAGWCTRDNRLRELGIEVDE